ncbi:unnamed protein product [Peronospora belbahrii]|uniref:Uncharacterized protein n=1 Tax=Peronospora belbahrii TaxID=622444 RepID=A0AAU9KM40_9STRA|nr:unnamed protein product [Peronospora belbahrii]
MARWLSFFRVVLGSAEFENSKVKLSPRNRARLHRYALTDGLLYYSTGSDDQPCVVVPHDEDLKYHILYKFHKVCSFEGGSSIPIMV